VHLLTVVTYLGFPLSGNGLSEAHRKPARVHRELSWVHRNSGAGARHARDMRSNRLRLLPFLDGDGWAIRWSGPFEMFPGNFLHKLPVSLAAGLGQRQLLDQKRALALRVCRNPIAMTCTAKTSDLLVRFAGIPAVSRSPFRRVG
jgi:hypothetical protein